MIAAAGPVDASVTGSERGVYAGGGLFEGLGGLTLEIVDDRVG